MKFHHILKNQGLNNESTKIVHTSFDYNIVYHICVFGHIPGLFFKLYIQSQCYGARCNSAGW